MPRLKVAVIVAAPGAAPLDAEIGAAVEDAARTLSRAGHHVSAAALPDSADIGEAAGVLWLTAIAEDIDFYEGRVGRPPEPDELEALTWAGLALGRRSSAVDYVRARRTLTRATRDMAERFRDFDVLLLPTTAQHAPRTGQIDGRTAAFDLERWNADPTAMRPITEIFNVTGQPAISLPLAVSGGGLPIGIQLAAPLGEDARLIALAAWLEREQPWSERLAACAAA